MRHALILSLLFACSCGGGGGSEHGAVILLDEFCAVVGDTFAAPAYTRTQYEDGTVVVRDEWGLEEEGDAASIFWNSAWQNAGGVLGQCDEESVAPGEVEDIIGAEGFCAVLDYSDGTTPNFSDPADFRDFLADHRQ